VSIFSVLEDIRDYGLETVFGRYYGKYLGYVEDTADSQGQGRVRVSCRVATGRSNVLAHWAHPSADYAGQDKGMFFPPDQDDLVWVWFDHGDPTQPRYSGSWWANRAKDKSSDGSFVPAEFNPGKEAPKKRGIKTKAGHGLLFDDTEDEQKVELWTGVQGDPGTAAERKHQVRLDSTKDAELVEVRSAEGHYTRWNDKSGEHAIESKTKKEHEVTISDEDDKITIKCKDGYQIVIDQKGKKITAETAVGQKIEMLDTPPTVNVEDSTGNKITLSPTGVDVVSKALVNVTAAGAVTVTAAGAASVTAGGALALTGAGLAITSAAGGLASMVASGVSSGSFIGIKSETYLGGLLQSITGAWVMLTTSALIVGLAPASILLGSLLGTKYKLVDERALIWLAQHTHTAIGLGTPTSAPIQTIVPELYTTNYVRAD
jgi:hypothetical protein